MKILAFVAALLCFGTVPTMRADAGAPCGGPDLPVCHVGADHQHGDFHGLIAIRGVPSVFDTAAHSGTKPGCGDCIWTLIVDCPDVSPTDPNHDESCPQADEAPGCKKGTLERLFLSDAEAAYQPEGTLCLHHGNRVIPIGDRARADVANYLKDVRPPNLVVKTRPKGSTLAGLPTYFTAAPPRRLAAHPFGDGAITETITIAPTKANWSWGDGQGTGWIAATLRQVHRYIHGGTARGTVIARWGAKYTITYQGETFGPYAATGTLTKRQRFTLPVDTSSPTLVSGGSG